MGNILGIYSGPARVSLYDSTNGVLFLGFTREANAVGEPQTLEAIDGNLIQHATLYKIDAKLAQSNQSIIDALKTRRGYRQEIHIMGPDNYLIVKNVFVAQGIKRPFKAGEPHDITIEAQSAVESDIVLMENLFGTDGNFNNDANSDGVADGWTAAGAEATLLETSFLSGRGQAQRITMSTGGDFYYQRLLPVDDITEISFGFEVKERGTAITDFDIYISFIDADGSTPLAEYFKSITLAPNEQKRVSFNNSFDPVGSAHYVRAGLQYTGGSVDIAIDDAQLEIGPVTSYKES